MVHLMPLINVGMVVLMVGERAASSKMAEGAVESARWIAVRVWLFDQSAMKTTPEGAGLAAWEDDT